MSDDKKYTGKIDRIRVSMTEDYEVDYYVEQYLKTKGYLYSAENKRALQRHINEYPSNGTVMRDALTEWLDARLKSQTLL